MAPNELNNKDVKRGASEVAESAAYINAHVQFVGIEPAKLEPCVCAYCDVILCYISLSRNVARTFLACRRVECCLLLRVSLFLITLEFEYWLKFTGCPDLNLSMVIWLVGGQTQ